MTKTKTVFISITVIIFLVLLSFWYARRYLGLNQTTAANLDQLNIVTRPVEPNSVDKQNLPQFKVEVIAEGLAVPWSVVFTKPDRILVTERAGSIRVVEQGKLRPDPLITFSDVDSTGEEGLMGLVPDPNYSQNNYLYACMAYPKNGDLVNRVVRLIDHQDSISNDTTVIDDIPSARFHAGCELAFGPDGKLYITTGDATDKNIAQDRSSLGGKILRLNADGTIPADNPFPNSAVWSYGHRNPQGISWHPETKELFSAEHGPSAFDGPAGGDEINLITKGSNYGWPTVSHEKSAPGMIDPLLVFTPAIAPSSAHFYAGDAIPNLKSDLLVAMLKGEGILRIVLAPPDFTTIASYQKLPTIDVGRIREITTGPDGAIYFATSNRDGRGEAQPGDDKIYRLSVE
jgi:aldose sugar dehydrogenase